MSNRNSYRLNGADRFQLYFDAVARKNTGIGNVIRAAVTVGGIIPETEIRQAIGANEWLNFLSSLSLKKNLFSSLYRFERTDKSIPISLTFHQGTYEEAMRQVVTKDCNLKAGTPLHVDAVYGENKTHLVFSVSHVLIDHAGMEILLSSFEGENISATAPVPVFRKSFFKKLADASSATMFVSSRSGSDMKRLKRKSGPGKAAFELMELTAEETFRVKNQMSAMNASALSFFLGCSLFSIGRNQKLLTGINYFVPVPMDRRPASCKNSLLSNFLSFIYFKAKDSDLESLKSSVELISKQTILQARKSIPQKFSSLLDIFRFVPDPFYKAFIDLPSKGHAATFAFSLLSKSGLEGKKILGYKVSDVTHYAPVISPPGLNVIFSEFNGSLKILCSFDESRISKDEVALYLDVIKLNLMGQEKTTSLRSQ